MKSLVKENFHMKIIEDLGYIHQTKNAKQKSRMALFECSDCKEKIKLSTSFIILIFILYIILLEKILS